MAAGAAAGKEGGWEAAKDGEAAAKDVGKARDEEEGYSSSGGKTKPRFMVCDVQHIKTFDGS